MEQLIEDHATNHKWFICVFQTQLYIYIYPIGSMYAIYGNIYHEYTPVMLAHIPAPAGSVMGMG